MKRLRRGATSQKLEGKAEVVRRQQAEQIAELQRVSIMAGKLIKDIRLPDGVDVPVSHGFGRRVIVLLSPIKQEISGATTGRILDQTIRTSSTYDPNLFFVLRATGFTLDVLVDAWVF